jgi:hypothetical protein
LEAGVKWPDNTIWLVKIWSNWLLISSHKPD